jgi:hypothetical protein
MTAPTLIDGLMPPAEPGAVMTALIIQNRFPGTVVWFGCYTRRWWAMAGMPGRAQLFEGADSDEITGAIINSLGFA